MDKWSSRYGSLNNYLDICKILPATTCASYQPIHYAEKHVGNTIEYCIPKMTEFQFTSNDENVNQTRYRVETMNEKIERHIFICF